MATAQAQLDQQTYHPYQIYQPYQASSSPKTPLPTTPAKSPPRKMGFYTVCFTRITSRRARKTKKAAAAASKAGEKATTDTKGVGVKIIATPAEAFQTPIQESVACAAAREAHTTFPIVSVEECDEEEDFDGLEMMSSFPSKGFYGWLAPNL